jgi:hypothetical protein
VPFVWPYREHRKTWTVEREQQRKALQAAIRDAIKDCDNGCDSAGRLDDQCNCPKHPKFPEVPNRHEAGVALRLDDDENLPVTDVARHAPHSSKFGPARSDARS